jgi:hypothetical protein
MTGHPERSDSEAEGSRGESFKVTSTGLFPAAGDFAQDDDVLRRGLRTSSPPQFGQTAFISSEQRSQKVHSNEQM